jgi:alpha-glucosidase
MPRPSRPAPRPGPPRGAPPRVVAATALAALAAAAATAAAPAARAQSAPAGPARGATYTLLGDVRAVERVGGGVLLRAERGSVLVESVAGVGARVRVRFGDGAAFPAPRSLATGDAPPALGAAAVRDAGDTVVIAAGGVEVRATRRPLRVSVRDASGRPLVEESFGAATFNGRLAHYARDLPGTAYYGLGEYALPNTRRNGGVYPFWNTDRPTVVGDPINYTSLPFYVGVRGGAAYGVLYDNPFEGEMDLANRLPGSIGYVAAGGPDGGELRWYVVPGPGLDSVAARFSRLTGRHPLPPRWALGYQQSRYSYAPDTVVANLAAEFRRRDVPADVIHLDIDYMDGYRVFTWSPTAFPRPKALLDSLARQGFKVVAIVDPGVKRDTAYRVFREGLALRAFATNPDGSLASAACGPTRRRSPTSRARRCATGGAGRRRRCSTPACAASGTT